MHKNRIQILQKIFILLSVVFVALFFYTILFEQWKYWTFPLLSFFTILAASTQFKLITVLFLIAATLLVWNKELGRSPIVKVFLKRHRSSLNIVRKIFLISILFLVLQVFGFFLTTKYGFDAGIKSLLITVISGFVMHQLFFRQNKKSKIGFSVIASIFINYVVVFIVWFFLAVSYYDHFNPYTTNKLMLPTFQVIHTGYDPDPFIYRAKDWMNIYEWAGGGERGWSLHKVTDTKAFPPSFSLICNSSQMNNKFCYYSRDFRYVFADPSGRDIIPGADVHTFSLINDSAYAKDKTHIYYRSLTLYQADYSTFQHISGRYAKDKNQVYFEGVAVPGADAATFTVEGDDTKRYIKTCVYDKYRIYYLGKPLSDADLESQEVSACKK